MQGSAIGGAGVIQLPAQRTVSSSHKLLADEGYKISQLFFKQIIEAFSRKRVEHRVAFIVVSHVVADLPDFLQSLKTIGRIAMVIFKGSYDYQKNHLYPQISGRVIGLADPFQQVVLENGKDVKENLESNPQYVLELVGKSIRSDEKFAILDIGGYFAQSLHLLEAEEGIKQRFLGVVEDTENGHQRYESYLNPAISKPLSSRVYSVARSKQKETEDYNVGKSIVHAANSMLRDLGRKIEEFSHIGVIGFGKIGKSISQHLRGMHVAHLYVHDRDPNIAMQIAATDYQIATRDEVIDKCSFIFSATGNHSLAYEDLLKISRSGREDVYIASVTSATDEFDERDFNKLASEEIVMNGKSYGRKLFENSQKKRTKIHFLAHGNAANFFYGNNVIGDYIRAVQAAILASTVRLISQKIPLSSKVQQLTPDEENIISRIWLKNFSKIHLGVLHNLSQDNQDLFIGRVPQLKTLSETLPLNSFFVLNLFGESGVGKTEFMLRYAHQHKEEYDIVWHVNSTDRYEALKRLYEKLHSNTQYHDYQAMLDKIAEKLASKNFLLTLDGTFEENHRLDEKIGSFIEKIALNTNNKSQHVVCVSQTKLQFDLEKLPAQSTIELKKLESGETRTFIVNQLKDSSEKELTAEQVHRLHQLLGDNNPIVLRLAVNTCRACGLTTDKFISWLQRNGSQKTPLLTLLVHLSLESLNKLTYAGKNVFSEILYILIHLNFHNLNFNLLKEVLSALDIGDLDAQFIIQKLMQHGLLEGRQVNGSSQVIYYMHQLVRDALNETMIQKTPGRLDAVRDTSIKVLKTHFDYDFYSTLPINYEAILFYKSHVQSLLAHLNGLDEFYLERTKIALRLASFLLNEQRDYVESQRYYQMAIEYLIKMGNGQRKDKYARLMLSAVQGKLVNMTELYRKSEKDPDKSAKLIDLERVSKEVCVWEKKCDRDYWGLKEIPITLSYVRRFLADSKTTSLEQIELLQEALQQLNQVDRCVLESPRKINTSTSHLVALAHHATGSLLLKLALLNEKKEDKVAILSKAVVELNASISIREKLNPSHPSLARAFYHLGRVCKELFLLDKSMKNLAFAKFYLKTAHNFQLEIFNGEHNDLLQTNSEIKKLDETIQNLKKEEMGSYLAEYKSIIAGNNCKKTMQFEHQTTPQKSARQNLIRSFDQISAAQNESSNNENSEGKRERDEKTDLTQQIDPAKRQQLGTESIPGNSQLESE